MRGGEQPDERPAVRRVAHERRTGVLVQLAVGVVCAVAGVLAGADLGTGPAGLVGAAVGAAVIMALGDPVELSGLRAETREVPRSAVRVVPSRPWLVADALAAAGFVAFFAVVLGDVLWLGGFLLVLALAHGWQLRALRRAERGRRGELVRFVEPWSARLRRPFRGPAMILLVDEGDALPGPCQALPRPAADVAASGARSEGAA